MFGDGWMVFISKCVEVCGINNDCFWFDVNLLIICFLWFIFVGEIFYSNILIFVLLIGENKIGLWDNIFEFIKLEWF